MFHHFVRSESTRRQRQSWARKHGQKKGKNEGWFSSDQTVNGNSADEAITTHLRHLYTTTELPMWYLQDLCSNMGILLPRDAKKIDLVALIEGEKHEICKSMSLMCLLYDGENRQALKTIFSNWSVTNPNHFLKALKPALWLNSLPSWSPSVVLWAVIPLEIQSVLHDYGIDLGWYGGSKKFPRDLELQNKTSLYDILYNSDIISLILKWTSHKKVENDITYNLIRIINNIDKGLVAGSTEDEIVTSTMVLVLDFLRSKRYGVVFKTTILTEQIIRNIVYQLINGDNLIGDFEYIKDSIHGNSVDVCQMSLGLLRLLTKTPALDSFKALTPGIIKYINKLYGIKYIVRGLTDSTEGIVYRLTINDKPMVPNPSNPDEMIDAPPDPSKPNEIPTAPLNTIANLEGDLMESEDIKIDDIVLWSPLYFKILTTIL